MVGISQPAGNPPPYVNRLTNSLYTIYYGCVTDEDNYFYEIFAYEITGLNQTPAYSFTTRIPTLFESAIYEPYPISFTSYGSYWKWPSSTVTSDTIVLTLEGDNEDLDMGTDVLGFGITYYVYNPPFPVETHGEQKWTWFEVVLDPDIQISGPEVSCSNPVSFYLLNMPTSYTSASWIIQQGAYLKASGDGTTAYANNLVNGPGQVVFTLHYDCGLKDVTLTKDFWFGVPGVPTVNPDGIPPEPMGIYSYQDISVTNSPGADIEDANWSSTGSVYTIWSEGQTGRFYSYTEGGAYFYVTTSNSCGNSAQYQGEIIVYGDQMDAISPNNEELNWDIIPNPTNTYFDLCINSNDISLNNKYLIEIFDPNSRMIRSITASELRNRIYLTDLLPGTYLVRLIFNKRAYQKILVIQ
jgi:hypothetical protein